MVNKIRIATNAASTCQPAIVLANNLTYLQQVTELAPVRKPVLD